MFVPHRGTGNLLSMEHKKSPAQEQTLSQTKTKFKFDQDPVFLLVRENKESMSIIKRNDMKKILDSNMALLSPSHLVLNISLPCRVCLR